MKKVITIYCSVLFIALSMASCNNATKIEEFVNTFYSSLELNNDGTNKSGKNEYYNAVATQKYYASFGMYLNEKEIKKYDGKLIFDDSLFKSFLTSNSIYSRNRVNNLTNMNHDQFNIKLIKIDSVLLEDYTEASPAGYGIGDVDPIKAAVVYSEVEYVIRGFAKFLNKEKLVINIEKAPFVLIKWEDIEVLTIMDETSLNLNQNDLYKSIGSLIMEQIADSIAGVNEFQKKQEKQDRDFWRSVGYDLGPEKYYQ
jgi:hypothetical protein